MPLGEFGFPFQLRWISTGQQHNLDSARSGRLTSKLETHFSFSITLSYAAARNTGSRICPIIVSTLSIVAGLKEGAMWAI